MAMAECVHIVNRRVTRVRCKTCAGVASALPRVFTWWSHTVIVLVVASGTVETPMTWLAVISARWCIIRVKDDGVSLVTLGNLNYDKIKLNVARFKIEFIFLRRKKNFRLKNKKIQKGIFFLNSILFSN